MIQAAIRICRGVTRRGFLVLGALACTALSLPRAIAVGSGKAGFTRRSPRDHGGPLRQGAGTLCEAPKPSSVGPPWSLGDLRVNPAFLLP